MFLSSKLNPCGNGGKYNYPLFDCVKIVTSRNNIYTPWVLIHPMLKSW